MSPGWRCTAELRIGHSARPIRTAFLLQIVAARSKVCPRVQTMCTTPKRGLLLTWQYAKICYLNKMCTIIFKTQTMSAMRVPSIVLHLYQQFEVVNTTTTIGTYWGDQVVSPRGL